MAEKGCIVVAFAFGAISLVFLSFDVGEFIQFALHKGAHWLDEITSDGFFRHDDIEYSDILIFFFLIDS